MSFDSVFFIFRLLGGSLIFSCRFFVDSVVYLFILINSCSTDFWFSGLFYSLCISFFIFVCAFFVFLCFCVLCFYFIVRLVFFFIFVAVVLESR